MAEIINLRQARKAKAKAEKNAKAETNRVQHGTPKLLRELNRTRSEKEARELDGHKKDED
jgi:hypothetical protein